MSVYFRRFLANEGFALDDTFTTTAGAGSVDGTSAEPGAGERQATSGVSITSGVLTVPGSTGSEHFSLRQNGGGTMTRTAGRAAYFVRGRTRTEQGWSSQFSNGQFTDNGKFIYNSNSTFSKLRLLANASGSGSGSVVGFYSNTETTTSKFVVVNRSGGGTWFAQKSTLSGDWRIVWYEDVSADTALAPRIYTFFGANAAESDQISVLDLTGSWTSGTAFFTANLSGVVSSGQTFSHDANFNMTFTVTTLPTSSTMSVKFRINDASNYFELRFTSVGNVELYEVVGGTPTLRSSGGGVSNGSVINMFADGNEIVASVGTSLRIAYNGSSPFATDTDGEFIVAADGAISDLVAYVRDGLSTADKAQLERFE